MARTAVTVTALSRGGTAQPSAQNADNTNGMALQGNNGKIALQLDASTGTVNFTIVTPGTVDGLAVSDRAIAVTSGTPKWVGGLPASIYNQSDGSVYINCDSANGRVRALRI